MASNSNNELHRLRINGSDGKTTSIKVDGPTLEALRNNDPTTTALILEAIGDPKTKGDEIVYLKEATSEADVQVASTQWTAEAESALMDIFRETDEKGPVKNRWAKISQKLKDAGFHFSSEQCRLKIKYLKEKFSKISKQRTKSGNGTPDTGVSDEIEEKMLLTFSTPDCKPIYVTESEKKIQSNDNDENPAAKKRRKTCDEKKDYGGNANKVGSRCRKTSPGKNDCFEGIFGFDDKCYEERLSVDLLRYET